ncbi:hypothetical protein [Salegentibacter maritimus]|nr:hypothetical protein [Salegentibacter maritimus]
MTSEYRFGYDPFDPNQLRNQLYELLQKNSIYFYANIIKYFL